jgi:hypothetical protein
MRCQRNILKSLLAFALAIGWFGLQLSCMAICAGHAEQSFCASDEASVTSIEEEDECCSLDTLRFLPSERIQIKPAGQITRPLPPEEIFGFYRRQNPNLISKAPQPASSPPLQRIPALRI